MAIRSKRYSIFFTRLNTKLRDFKLNNQFSLGLMSVENLGVEGKLSKILHYKFYSSPKPNPLSNSQKDLDPAPLEAHAREAHLQDLAPDLKGKFLFYHIYSLTIFI